MKKHYILHIGCHKTGSSAIQRFLAMNRNLLLSQNTLYPQCYKNNLFARHKIKWLSPDGHNNITRLQHHCCKYQTAPPPTLQRFYDEISATDTSKIILSSEGFPKLNPYLENFKSVLKGDNYTIIVYIRRWDHYLTSLYSQFICNPAKAVTDTCDEFIVNAENHITSLYKRLVAFTNHFGVDNIKLIPFESSTEPQWLINSFCRAAGLSTDAPYQLPARHINTRKPQNILSVIRALNTLPCNPRLRRVINNTIISVGSLLKSTTASSDVMLSNKRRLTLLNEFKHIEESLANKFLPDNNGKIWQEAWPNEKDC